MTLSHFAPNSLYPIDRNPRKSQRFSILSIQYFLTVVLIGVSCVPSFAQTAGPTPLVEFSFSGTTSTTTKSFTIQGGWEVVWETKSKFFQLSAFGVTEAGYSGVMTEQEKILRSFETFEPIVLANSTDSKGKVFHPVGGTFRLKVLASGSWTIHLKSVKRTKDYLDVPYTGAP